MNRSDFTALTTGVHQARMNLMLGKSHDYATDDVLSNFKRMNHVCELFGINTSRGAWDCAMFLALIKIDRWCNLVNSDKAPVNEKIEDTVCDLHNYIDLAYGIKEEEKKKA